MKIASYFVTAKIEIDKNSVKKLDQTLISAEARLAKFAKNAAKPIKLNIDNFDVNQAKLRTALGNALDATSPKVAFEISRFVVNDRNLQAALLRAARRLPTPPPGPHPPYPPGGGPHPPYPPYPPHPGPGSSAARYAAGGLMTRGLSSFYGPALALGFGGYGLSQLNQKNQQVVSAQLQTSAIVQQAEGTKYTPEMGGDAFNWLRNQAKEVGFNYLDAAPDYNRLLSGLTGAGMSVKQGQSVFKGFSEYARVYKLDKVQQQRVFRALSQIAGKNKLQSEELVGQLAESAPGAVSLFAEAYQRQIKGSKTGNEAITELLAAMKKGDVKGDILTFAGDIAAERAGPGLTAAKKASQAEQGRYESTLADLAVIASQAGVEEGFARIFRTLNNGLKESGDLVRFLSEGFNEATMFADDLLLWPQSFMRALEGRDSLVADWLGADRTRELIEDWKSVKELWGQIAAIEPNDLFGTEFLPTLQATTREMAAILAQLAAFRKWTDEAKGLGYKDAEDVDWKTRPISWGLQNIGRLINGVDSGLEARKARGRAVYEDPTSPYYQDPERYDSDMALGINRNQDLSSMQFPTRQDELQFEQDKRQAAIDEYSYRNQGTLPLFPLQMDVAGSAKDELSRNNPFSDALKSSSDDAKFSAMTGGTVNSNNTNNNTVTVNVNVTNPEGVSATDERQVQVLARAVADEIVKSMEQTQDQFPAKQ